MTIEKKLKNYILSRYKSVLEFTQAINMPYSTFATILTRGVDNASVLNIIKICQGLGISADALADGEIVPLSRMPKTPEEAADLLVEFDVFEARVLAAKRVTVKGKELSKDELREILNILEIGLEIGIRKEEEKRKTANKNHNKTDV